MNSFERKPSSTEAITLAAGQLQLELSPSIGGAISSFEWSDERHSRPILRKVHRPLQKVLDACNFPLVPYVNRIRGGSFSFRGRDVNLKPNMAGDPSPLHGQGWLNPWTVVTADEKTAVLSYRHESGEWPWSYEAVQDFRLDENGLSVALACRNVDSEPMPCGLGQHPYFPCGSETMIDTRVRDVWTVDEKVLPLAKVPAEGRYDLSNRPVCGQGLDNGFGGWSGEVRISDPGWPFDLQISSSSAGFFQVYSPSSGGIFVAEPVTHANAALNAPEEEWSALGLEVLQPGEEMSLSMRLDVIMR